MRVKPSSLLPVTYVNGMEVADYVSRIALFARVSRRSPFEEAACLRTRFCKWRWKMAAYHSTSVATNPRAETAIFNNREDADSAYDWLLKCGYDSDEIHLLMSEETRHKYHYPEHAEPEGTEDDSVRGLETGAAFGSGL